MLALLAAGALAPPALAESRTYAFSDTALTETPDGLAAKLGEQRRELCTPKPTRPRALSLARARRNAERFLRRKAGNRALRAFARSRDARDVRRAMAAAAGATAAGRPHAALAALLRAGRLKPGDPAPLVAAAPILTNSGLADEALAFLTAAARKRQPKHAPFGLEPAAVIANNRGFALLALGQWRLAKKQLERAARQSPLLVEAHLNLAQAELCLGNRAKAGRAVFLGARRQPWTKRDLVGTGPNTRVASSRLFDLSKGVTPSLLAVRFPSTVQEGAALSASYGDLLQEAHAVSMDLSARMHADVRRAYQEMRHMGPASRRRAQAIRVIAALVEDEPDLQPIVERHDALSAEFRDKMLQYFGSGQVEPDCSGRADWVGTLDALDTAARNRIVAVYRRQTAIAANLKNAAVHDAVVSDARSSAQLVWRVLLQSYAIIGQYDARCDPPEEQSQQAASGEQTLGGLPACPSGLAGKGFGFAFTALTVSVDCETVGVEVESGGWLGGFVKVSKNFRNGQTTVYGGPRAKVSAFGAGGSVKNGGYVTVDSSGSVVDVGVRVEIGVDLSAGPAQTSFDAGSMNFTLVGLGPAGAGAGG